MEKTLRKHLSKLKMKYHAEEDLHEEVQKKIVARILSLFENPGDFRKVEETVLAEVERSYKRMLGTKRHLKETKKNLQKLEQITQRNYRMLKDIQQALKKIVTVSKQLKKNQVSTRKDSSGNVRNRGERRRQECSLSISAFRDSFHMN